VTVESEPSSSLEENPEPAGADDRAAFDAMFRAYADHVFEYCNGLLGDERSAAAATQATFITAYSMIRYLRNPRRMEAWLYALARRECTSKDPGRAELPAYIPAAARRNGNGSGPPKMADDDVAEFAAVTDSANGQQATAEALAALTSMPERDRAVLAAFGKLRQRDREIIDLVYWRGVDRSELPYILGVSERQAAALLSVAEKKLGRLAERTQSGGTEPSPEQEVGLLAVMPPAVWRHTVTSLFDEDCATSREAVATHAGLLDAEGFPEQPAPPAMRSRAALTTSAVITPAVVGLVALSALGGPARPGGTPPVQVGPHGLTIVIPSPDPPSVGQAAHRSKTRSHRRGHGTGAASPPAYTQPVVPVQPTGSSHPSPSPAPITSAPPTITASPSPTSHGSPSPTTPPTSPTSNPSSPSPGVSPTPSPS
jgi:RNA polymerase sigma factor (sigma-70 family)